MRQVGLSIHAHSISDKERLGSFALRVLKLVWIYNNRTYFFFAEDAVSESGYDGDNEASSSDSSDDGNQGTRYVRLVTAGILCK